MTTTVKKVNHTYISCNAKDKWVTDIKKILDKLFKQYNQFDTVVWVSSESIEVLPMKFIQYQNALILFKKDSINLSGYEELIKIFAFFVDRYYHSHSNYFKFLDGLAKLQRKNNRSPSSFAFIADMMDMFYMCVMAGKFADRNKKVKIQENVIKPIFVELEKGYKGFALNPFVAMESACVYSTLKNFYKISYNLTYPNYQSANIILKQIETIVADAISAIGDRATLDQANRFFNIAYTYLDTSINDIRIKK